MSEKAKGYVNGIESWRPSGICHKCNERSATEMWAAEGVIGAVHGCYQFWCKRCVVAEQLAHAKKMAERIPDLERKFATLMDG